MDDSLLSITRDSRQNPFTSSPPQHTRTTTKGIGFHAHFLKHSDEKISKRSIVDPRNNPIILAGGGLKHGGYVTHNRNNLPEKSHFVFD